MATVTRAACRVPTTGSTSTLRVSSAPFASALRLRYASTETSIAKVSADGVVGHPIDFDINSKVEGNESQIVTITLEPGQVLRAESGAMMYMTQGVEMNTTTG